MGYLWLSQNNHGNSHDCFQLETKSTVAEVDRLFRNDLFSLMTHGLSNFIDVWMNFSAVENVRKLFYYMPVDFV